MPVGKMPDSRKAVGEKISAREWNDLVRQSMVTSNSNIVNHQQVKSNAAGDMHAPSSPAKLRLVEIGPMGIGVEESSDFLHGIYAYPLNWGSGGWVRDDNIKFYE